MSCQHRKVAVYLLVCPQENGNLELLGLFHVDVVPQSEDCVDLELPCDLYDLLRVVLRLGNEVGHGVEDTSSLSVGVFDEAVQETSLGLLRIVRKKEDLDHRISFKCCSVSGYDR